MGKDNEMRPFKLGSCRGMFWNIMLRGVGRGGNVCGRLFGGDGRMGQTRSEREGGGGRGGRWEKGRGRGRQRRENGKSKKRKIFVAVEGIVDRSRALKKDSQMNSTQDSVYENGTEGKEKKKKKKRLEKQDEKKKNEFLTKKGRDGNAKPTSIRSIRQKAIDEAMKK